MTPAEIHAARKSLGLTQEQLARVMGYGGKARISEFEHGTRKPSDQALRLMRAYLEGYRPQDWPEGVK